MILIQIFGGLLAVVAVFLLGWGTRQMWDEARDEEAARLDTSLDRPGLWGFPKEILRKLEMAGHPYPLETIARHACFAHRKFMSHAQARQQVFSNSQWFGVEVGRQNGWRKAHTANYWVWFDERIIHPDLGELPTIGDPANRKPFDPLRSLPPRAGFDPGEPDASLDVSF